MKPCRWVCFQPPDWAVDTRQVRCNISASPPPVKVTASHHLRTRCCLRRTLPSTAIPMTSCRETRSHSLSWAGCQPRVEPAFASDHDGLPQLSMHGTHSHWLRDLAQVTVSGAWQRKSSVRGSGRRVAGLVVLSLVARCGHHVGCELSGIW